MKKKENIYEKILPNKQEKLFSYNKYFKLFINLYENNLLPSKILLSGQSGIGKSTFVYHFINYVLSKQESYPYDLKNFTINPLNKSFRKVSQLYHPNFYLIENYIDKKTIDIKQVRSMIEYTSKTTYEKKIKFVLINLHSVNALLKTVEEPTSNTFLFLIHDSTKKLIATLKSRCVEFKIFFSQQEKESITNNLLKYYSLKNDLTSIQNICTLYENHLGPQFSFRSYLHNNNLCPDTSGYYPECIPESHLGLQSCAP